MSRDVRVLFREVVGLPTLARRRHYQQSKVPTAIYNELESLLAFDDGEEETPLTGVVRGAAEHFLLSQAPVSEGRRCGPYRLLRVLGNGGMGAVYLAERADGEVEQKAAIKFLHASASSRSFRDRFLRERQILASLNHPGIARLLDVGHSAGQPYLAMEYVSGVHIDRYAQNLGQRAVLELFIRVAEAVAYAHRNLIVHRDIKPSNILVDATGQPKLLDFGIAKLLDSPTQAAPTIECAMTPEYASPEQFFGGTQATFTDIYSLGAVLQKLLTGRSPREAALPSDELPRDLTAIVRKALHEDPAQRYLSVDLFIADLQAYLEHRPVQARRGNIWYYAGKFARRRWLSLAAGTLALIGTAGGAFIANQERVIAEHRFQQVRQISRQFLDLDAEIRTLPGSVKARTRIVSASLEYLQRLDTESRHARWTFGSGQEHELTLEMASAYLKVARVQGVPVAPNLGQFTEARRSLERAAALVDSLLAQPSFPHRRAALLTSAEIARDTMILAETNHENDVAVALGRKAVNHLELFLAFPDVSAAEARTVAGLYVNVAQAFCNMHRLEESTRYAHRTVEIAQNMAHDQRQLAKALGILSNTFRYSGDIQNGLQSIQASRAISEKLADPNNSESLLQLAGSLWREGLVLGDSMGISVDRPQLAIPVLQRSLDIAEDLARKDTHDYTSRSYVTMGARELGSILRDRDPARALAVYGQGLARGAEIANNAKARREESYLLAGSSYALRNLGRNAEAGQRAEASLKMIRSIETCPGKHVVPGQECYVALRAVADHYAATGQLSRAIQAYEELQPKLQASDNHPSEDIRSTNNLACFYRNLGQLYHRAGNSKAAEDFHQRAVAVWTPWTQRPAANTFVQRRIAEFSKPYIN